MSNTSKLKVLVTGATGKQGGAVARRLIERGHTVRALTRKPDGAPAKALAALGAEIVTGDLSDRGALDQAVKGVSSVFSMGTPFEAGEATETKQGITVADAAHAAGAFLVYTSVANADKNTKIPHFDSKFAVEQHIKKIGAKSTILAPVYFMENVMFGAQQLREGVYATPLTPDRKLWQVAVADIAAAAVAALEQPEKHAGQRYDLGGDELSGQESLNIISKAVGKPLNYYQLPMEMVRKAMSEDAAIMYLWFQNTGYTVDRAKLSQAFPEVSWTSYEAWAKTYDFNALLAR